MEKWKKMQPAGQKMPSKVKKAHSFTCSSEGCNASFKKQQKLKEHMAGHTGEKPWHCTRPGCDKAFARQRRLQEHMQKHLEQKKYICTSDGCRAAYSTKTNLSRHTLYKHGDPMPLKCTVSGCKKTFRKKRALRVHLSEHTREPLFVCDLPGCGWKSSSAARLTAHRRKHAGYRCPFQGCQVVSPTWTSLQMHRKKHPCELKCAKCGKPFKKLNALRRHKATHVERPMIKLPCPRKDCDKTFTNAFTLTHHIRKIHLCLQTYHCYHSGCNRTFAMRESLIRHLVVHDPEKKKLKLKSMQRAQKPRQRGTINLEPAVEQDLSYLFSRKLLFHFKARMESNLSGLFNERLLRDPAETEVNLSGLFQLPPVRARAEKAA